MEPGTDTDRDARRLRETAALLGAHPPDATIRADALAGSASLDRTLPHVVIEHKGDVATAGNRETFTLGELLGEGGMGKVYAGLQRSLGRGVALKVLEGGSKRDPAHAALLHEARVTGRLEHPNIVPVHVLGVDGAGQPVMVMKRIEGVSWRRLLHEPSHPAWERLLARHRDRPEAHVEILLRVCDALEYAHARGVIHRDLKPDNVMLGAFGEVYLLDWGVALDTRAPRPEKAVVGTPSYMAPEMVEGDPAAVSPATDVYLLGAALHEALTGTPRHAGATLLAVLLAAYQSSPVAYGANVPPELAALCNEATAREAAQRPATIDAFRAKLLAWRRHRGSIELSDEAARALERALAPAAAQDREVARRSLREARLGFSQALATWPDNEAARAGLGRTFEALVRRALDDESPAAARALYAAWPDPDPALAREIDALAERTAAGRSLSERAAAREREMDTSASRGGHSATLALFSAVVVVFTGSVVARVGTSGPPPSLKVLLSIEVALLVGGAVITAVLRRHMLGNMIGRRLTVLLLGGILTILAADVAADTLGADAFVATVMHLVILGFGLLTVATQGLPALALPAVISFATGVAIAVAPGRINVIAMVGTLSVALSLLWVIASGRLGAALPLARPVTGASQPPPP